MNQVEIKRRQIEIGSWIIGLINILLFGRILGNNGITYLVIALEAFSFIWTISAGCIADTLGKMLRMRMTKGQYKNAICIRKRVLIMEGILGVLCSILFAVCSGLIATNVFKVPNSTFIMAILAPALLMRAVSAVLIGFFQGEGNWFPCVVAAPLKQVLIMGLGLLFANILGKYGDKVSALLGDTNYTAMYGAMGIAIAIDLAELIVLVFLGVLAIGNRKSLLKRGEEGMKQTDSLLNTVRILYGSMWMAILLRFFEQLPFWIGTIFYRKKVADLGNFIENFDPLAGKYFVICGIPILLVCVMLISVNMKAAGAFRREDQRSAKMIFQSGLHLVVVQALFFTVFVAVMAQQLAGFVCETGAETVTKLLRHGSIFVLFAALFYYFSRLLMLIGRKYHLLGCLGVANILFIIIATVLLNVGKAGILSLVYACLVTVGLGCIALGFLCCKELRTGIDWLQSVAVPVGAACVTGLIIMLLSKLMTPHLGNFVTIVVSLVFSTIIYWAILLLLRNVREQELKYIPGGRMIRVVGQLLRIFKK